MTILVVCSHDAALLEYIGVFADQTTVRPLFCLSHQSRYADLLDANNFEYIQFEGRKAGSKSKKNRFLKWLLDNTWLGCLIQTFIIFHILKSRLELSLTTTSKRLTRLIDSESVSFVMVQSDRSAGLDAAAILAANNRNLPVIVLSFAYSADYKSSYKLRTSRIYRFIHRQPIQAVYTDDELGTRSFFRPFESCALSEMGLMPSNPWILGGSGFVTVLLEGDRELNRLLSLGGNKQSYLVTGLASHDRLHALWTQEDKKNRTKKTIVVALPQYWEHKLASKSTHFAYLDGLLMLLSNLQADVLVSLHPKMLYADYEYMSKRFDVEICREPLWSIIPHVDLLISTFSSTVAWALMCKKPVIIVDHLGLNYKDFYSEFKIPVCKTNSEVADLAEQMLRDSRATDPELEAFTRHLSPFDGLCRDRILSVFD